MTSLRVRHLGGRDVDAEDVAGGTALPEPTRPGAEAAADIHQQALRREQQIDREVHEVGAGHVLVAGTGLPPADVEVSFRAEPVPAVAAEDLAIVPLHEVVDRVASVPH